MQSNKQVLRAMVESEEVSLQATAEAREQFCCSKCDREVIPQFGGQEGEFSGTRNKTFMLLYSTAQLSQKRVHRLKGIVTYRVSHPKWVNNRFVASSPVAMIGDDSLETWSTYSGHVKIGEHSRQKMRISQVHNFFFKRFGVERKKGGGPCTAPLKSIRFKWLL